MARPFAPALVVALGLSFAASSSLRAQERTAFALPNGLRVRLVPVKGESKTAVMMGVKGGFLAEPDGVPHLAHVAEHCLVFGAPAGSDEAKAIDRWYNAGQANAETLPTWMYFDLYPGPGELDLALRVQADRLKGAGLSSHVLEREVPRALAEVENLEHNENLGTGKMAYVAFVQAALYGKTDVPLKARTRTLKLDDLRAFHRRSFHPDRAIVAVVGDVNATEARKAIEAAFGSIPKSPSPAPEIEPRLKPGPLTVTWDLSTRHVIAAWPVPKPAQADHAALSVAALMGMQRLFQDRELNALAKMPMVTNEVEGLFLVNVQARPGADVKALEQALLDGIGRLAKAENFEVTQMRSTFQQMVDPPALALVLQPSRVMARANVELQRIPRELSVGDLGAYTKRVGLADGPKVRAAVAKYLDPRKATLMRIEPKP